MRSEGHLVHSPCIFWWLLTKAHHRPFSQSDTSCSHHIPHWIGQRKSEIFIFDDIDKHAGAGTRVESEGARGMEGGHIF
jgi:hypothetical protein